MSKYSNYIIISYYYTHNLLLEFLAQTITEGWLGSPAPDALMADTLNSYSDPSDTFFTEYFNAGKRQACLSIFTSNSLIKVDKTWLSD